MFNQKRDDCPKYLERRKDVSSVMDLSPCTISFMRLGGTPKARAREFCVSPKGFMYSSRRISPGVRLFKVVVILDIFNDNR